MQTHYLLLGCTAIGAGIFWACGSDEDAAVVNQGDGGAASSSSSSGGGTSSSGATSGSSSGTSGGNDGGGTSSGALGGDGGINPPDAGPGGDTTKIACGTTFCALANDECCVAELGGGQRSYGCASVDAGCPTNGGDVAALKCSGQANCPSGMVCCVRQTNAGAASACKATCTGDEAQLCDKNAADAGCPPSDPCSSADIGDWGLSNAYATCGGQGN